MSKTEPIDVDEQQRILTSLWEPHDGQRAIMAHGARFKVVACGRRWGKALALDTPIPTPDGWSIMGDVSVGDHVYDEEGEICTVTAATPTQYGRPCYEVVFGDGTAIIADADHQWFTCDKAARKSHARTKNPTNHPKVRTTEEIKDTLTVNRTDGRFEANHRVPVADTLTGQDPALSADPYVLGAWLGDGNTDNTIIHTGDPEIIEHVRDAGYPAKEIGGEYAYSISDGKRPAPSNSLHSHLKEAEVFYDKHIPEEYYTAPEADRLALLQGLMDTDGTCDKAGWCEFTGMTKRLVRGFRRLCSTLGITSRFHTGDAMLDGEVVGTKYRVKFRTDRPAFRLEHKLERQQAAPDRSGNGFRSITEVNPVESVPVRCIQVDSPNHLYLAGETCIPTHNSEMCAHLGLEHALENNDAVVWWVAPTYDLANDYGFDKMKPLLSPDILDGEPKLTKPRKISLDNGSEISFRSAEREDSLRGGGVDLLIMDESASIPERAWIDELRPTLTDTLGDMIAIGTPKGRNWFYRWFQRGQSSDHPDVASWQAPSKQNTHVPNSEIEAAKEDMPERVYEQEYLAKFVDDTGGVFENVRENVESYPLPVAPEDATEPYAIGVDFARFEDFTVVVVLDANGRVVAFRRMNETTWTRIQNTVEQLAETYSPNTAAVDATRDNKIVQDLEDAGINVEPVSFSSSKKRTLIENLITRLETGEVTLPSEANALINELEVFEYDMDEGGKVSYHAPTGFHDDTVDALALAVEASSSRSGAAQSGFIITR